MPLQQMALINFFLYVHFKNNKKTNPAVTSLPKQRLALPQPIMKDSITVQCYSNYYKIKKKKMLLKTATQIINLWAYHKVPRHQWEPIFLINHIYKKIKSKAH